MSEDCARESGSQNEMLVSFRVGKQGSEVLFVLINQSWINIMTWRLLE